MLVWRELATYLIDGFFFFLFETLLPFARAAGEKERERESYTVVLRKRAAAA